MKRLLLIALLFPLPAIADAPAVKPHTLNWLSEQAEVELRMKTADGRTARLVTANFSDLNARYLKMSVPCWNKVSPCPPVAAITVRLYLKVPWIGRANVTRYVLCEAAECLMPPISSPLQVLPGQSLTATYDRMNGEWSSHPSIVTSP